MSRQLPASGQVRLDDLVHVCRNGTEINTPLLKEMLGLFIDENTRRLAAARDAARLGHAADLRAAIHAMKGSAALIGADRLRALAADLERSVVNETIVDPLAATEQLREEFSAVVATLHSLYPDLASA